MLEKLWYGKIGFLNYVLMPFSFMYKIIILIRYYFHAYRQSDFNSNIPVIIVGNLTVGGTGKTPFVIWLSEFLKQKGYYPGIVSRGYGGKSAHYPYDVQTDSPTNIAGDEAVLLARRTHCPVIVAPKRVSAVKYLLKNYPQCNIIISDDGLQHYNLKRDIEIVIVDGERGFGNELCLPAGPLREPLSRLKNSDFMVINGKANHTFKPYFPAEHTYSMTLLSDKFHNLISPDLKATPEDFQGQVLHAVAGIGNPNRFFNSLKNMGLSVFPHAFPDHYNFSSKDFDFDQENKFLMTEKDAVKCCHFADYRYWHLPVSAQIPKELGEKILGKLA